MQLINTALPYGKRLVVSSDPAPPLAAIEDVPDGQIFIDFAPTREDWNLANPTYPDYVSALADPDDILEYDHGTQVWQSKGARAGHVWFSVEHLLNQAWVLNPGTNQFELVLLDEPAVESDTVQLVHTPEDILSTMVHELLHVLGFYGHNDGDRFPDSNMRDDVLLLIDHLPRIDGDGCSRFTTGSSRAPNRRTCRRRTWVRGATRRFTCAAASHSKAVAPPSASPRAMAWRSRGRSVRSRGRTWPTTHCCPDRRLGWVVFWE